MKIIFLAYLNRSGSTYLANLLSKSPDIAVCPEAEAILQDLLEAPGKDFQYDKDTRKRFGRVFHTDPKLKYWNLEPSGIKGLPEARQNAEAFAAILDAYRDKQKPGASVVLYKAERLIHLIHRLPEQFKKKYDLKCIGLIRDCRAVYASQRSTLLPGLQRTMANNPVKTGIMWNAFVRISLDLNGMGNFCTTRYEDLINNLQTTLNTLLRQIGLSSFDFESGRGDLLARIPEDHKHMHTLVESPPVKEKILEWENKLSRRDRIIIEKITGRNMRELKYCINEHNDTMFMDFLWIAFFELKYTLENLFNKVLYRILNRVS